MLPAAPDWPRAAPSRAPGSRLSPSPRFRATPPRARIAPRRTRIRAPARRHSADRNPRGAPLSSIFPQRFGQRCFNEGSAGVTSAAMVASHPGGGDAQQGAVLGAPDNPARASRLAPAPGGPLRRTRGGPGRPGHAPWPMARTWHLDHLRPRGAGPGGQRLFLPGHPGRGQHRRLARHHQRPLGRRAEHPADGPGKPLGLDGYNLPASILAKLHAGNAQAVANGTGGNATNTLILIHIFAGFPKRLGSLDPARRLGEFRRAWSDRSRWAILTKVTA